MGKREYATESAEGSKGEFNGGEEKGPPSGRAAAMDHARELTDGDGGDGAAIGRFLGGGFGGGGDGVGLGMGQAIIAHGEDIGSDIGAEGATGAGSSVNFCVHGMFLLLGFCF